MASNPTQSDPLLSVENVTVNFEQKSGGLNPFRKPTIVNAVNDVSFELFENDIIALVGESGCGKTTLGKAAIGLQEPTEGTISYKGQDIYGSKRKSNGEIPFSQIRRSLQIIHQDPGSSLNPNQRILTSLSQPLKKWYSNLSRSERQEYIFGMLETVGMAPPDDYAYRYPHQLSGGEKQRIALVRALLMNPTVILGDEAISALDVSLRVDMMDLILELQDRFDTSYIFISHDLSNARYLAENANGRIGVMYLGQLVEIGPAREIIHDPQHPYTKALRWATPELFPDRKGTLPLRDIDVPDPTDPPSGCRFHTRCPEARETCRKVEPRKTTVDGSDRHMTKCFRNQDDHEYWESEELSDD